MKNNKKNHCSYKSILLNLLNLNTNCKIKIINATFSADNKELHIEIDISKKNKDICPRCGKKGKHRDEGRGQRQWRLLNFGITKTFIHYSPGRIYCDTCDTVVTSKVPWANHDSWFTNEFEETVAWLAINTSKNVVSNLMGINWATVGDIVNRIQKRRQPQTIKERFAGVTKIGIDEVSHKKGHSYLTVITNLDNGQILWVTKKHGKSVFEEICKELGEEICNNITHVAGDGARWIWEVVEEYMPNATECVDPFHVIGWMLDALDEVRKEEWNKARKELADSKKEHGRKSKDNDIGEKEDKAKSIKNSRFVTGMNVENLTDKQKAQLNFIASSNPTYYKAYELKEELRICLKYDTVDDAFENMYLWIKKARKSEIKAFIELADKIERHRHRILNTIEYKYNTGVVESNNNKIKLLIRIAYGFRNLDNLFSLIYLKCSVPKPILSF